MQTREASISGLQNPISKKRFPVQTNEARYEKLLRAECEDVYADDNE